LKINSGRPFDPDLAAPRFGFQDGIRPHLCCHPDPGKYLIAKARGAAYAYYRRDKDSKWLREVRGSVAELLTDNIHVPRQFHTLIEKPAGNKPHLPWQYSPDGAEAAAYQVTLAYWERYETWVEGGAPGTTSP
jgi:hypothetical protein